MGFYKKGFFRGQFYSLFVYLNRLGAFSHTCYEQKGPVFFLDCVMLTVVTPSVSNKNIDNMFFVQYSLCVTIFTSRNAKHIT